MNTNGKNIVVLMILIGSMFALGGLALGMNAFFIPFVKGAFNVSTSMSYLIITATFSAFIVFGPFSGRILEKAGYKGGMVIAFVFLAVGYFLIAPAARIISFPLLLLALFIGGIGQALLTAAVNTYIAIIGPVESAAKRIAIMGICNKVFYAASSLMLAFFMDLTNIRVGDMILPFYIFSSLLLIFGLLYYFAPLPEIKAAGEADEDNSEASVFSGPKKSILDFPHLLLGIIAMFFVVGLGQLALGSINDYATVLDLPSPENYVWLVSGGFIIGYLAGVIFIPKYLKQNQALLLSTVSGIIVTFLIVIVPVEVSIYFVGLLGLSNALIFPSVWPLAIADLGKYTKKGSSLLVTGVIGGALMPLLFGYIAEILSYQVAYLICIPAYLYIMYYALSGSKKGKKYI